MKTKIILAAAALALSFGVAHAGDKTFDGFYLGGQGQYSSSKADGDKDKTVGAMVLGGYGTSYGKWYIGGEMGLGYSGVKNDTDSGTLKRDFEGTLAARGGYEFTNKVLGYGLVGLEGAHTKFEGVDGTDKTFDYGIRYGVGVEAAVRKNWTVRTELDYIDWKGKGAQPSSNEVRASVGVGYHF